jgi:hypothetical protein
LPQNVVPSGLPSAADCSLRVSVAVASEMSAASTAAAAIASTIVATADAAAVNATAAAAHNPTRHHHPSPPTLPTAIVASGDAVEAAETTSKRDAMSSVISSTAKISLRAYFEGANWPLNKALPRAQVARQLLKYKKGKFMNTQVSILLNPSDLDERIREGIYGRVCVIDTYEDLRS